jgi:5-methyltetrahydropteroyltriglutamate--homocysteine methyltransferase
VSDVRFLTHEIGSLAKPPWHVKTAAGRPLEESDVEHARSWGERLAVPGHEELVELLARPGDEGAARAREVARWSSSLAKPYHHEELEFLQSIAEARLKIPVTGAYTLAIWSYDEHYAPKAGRLGAPAGRRREIEARREFALDIARNLIRPNLEALIALGADWIQIDEPGASTEPDELEVFVESFNASVEGLDCLFSTHLCFSDYDLFFPAIEGMSGCGQYAVGFANYDTRELGASDADRPGYRVIRKFRDLAYRPALGLGVLDIHTDFVEPPELVRDRILYAVDVFGDPGRIHVTPDCGLRTRSWDVAYAKLANMVEGARMAEAALDRAVAGARAPGA